MCFGSGSYIFSKKLNKCLTDINIYPMNNKTDHFLEKYFSNRKKSKKKVGIFSIFRSVISRNGSRIRIQIKMKMKRIRNTDITVYLLNKGSSFINYIKNIL